jgi:hypothetical protein
MQNVVKLSAVAPSSSSLIIIRKLVFISFPLPCIDLSVAYIKYINLVHKFGLMCFVGATTLSKMAFCVTTPTLMFNYITQKNRF